MTVANVYGLMIPELIYGVTSFGALLLDASGEMAGAVLQAPKTGSIRKVHFRTGTVTSATDTDVRLETVSATDGLPTGTLFGTTTNVTVTSASITANAWITSGALTADASVTKGDLLAVVIAPTGSPNYQVAGSGNYLTHVRPYNCLKTSGTWAKAPNLPNLALEYSDGSFAYIPYIGPFSAVNAHTGFASNTTPDERAVKFQLAAPVRVCGAWVQADFDGDVDVVLYDSDGSTALATVSIDKDIRAISSQGTVFATFSSAVQLSASTYYRLAVKPTSTTGGAVYSVDVNAAGILDQLAGGQDFHYSERTDAGSWTDTTTRRLLAGLIIDGIDDGAGAGGGGGPLVGGRLVQ